jgi:hypothetical protein
MWETVHTSIVQGSIEAARFNRDVVNGRYKDWDARHIAVMQRAADSLMDRAGHLPWTRPSDNSQLPGPQEDHRHLIAGKSIDELLALALGTATGAGHDSTYPAPANGIHSAAAPDDTIVVLRPGTAP